MKLSAALVALAVLALAAPAHSRDILQAPVQAPATSPSTAITDVDILNFALNLEYLEATFYSWAAFGKDLDASLVGSSGQVSGGQQANLSGDYLAYAQQIAYNEIDHVTFLRTALGSAAVSRPALNVGTAFSDAANAAFGGTTLSPAFSPYLNDLFFLHGAFIFEDAGVTAYHGAVPLIQNKTYLTAAAGIMDVEAYHGGIVRALLCPQINATTPYGVTPQVILDNIANLENSLAKDTASQGINTTLANGATVCNLVPADSNALAFSRTPSQIIAIVTAGKGAGLFFPSGLNGNIK